MIFGKTMEMMKSDFSESNFNILLCRINRLVNALAHNTFPQ